MQSLSSVIRTSRSIFSIKRAYATSSISGESSIINQLSQPSLRSPPPSGYTSYDSRRATKRVAELSIDTTGPSVIIDENDWWTKASEAKGRAVPGTQYLGRTVLLGGRDKTFGGAYKRLGAILQRTGLRRDIRLGEFHEKRSDKRVRLESERHRKRFQEMVRTKVQTVQMIKSRQ